MEAALGGARLRLRPILMTSFAFILGCVPLWFASGAGSVARQIMGTTVIGGMLAASAIAIFFIPAIFYVVERLSGGKRTTRARAFQRHRLRRRATEMRRLALLSLLLLADRMYRGPELQATRDRYTRRLIEARLPSSPASASAESLGNEKWWEVFQDPVLQQLIRTALQQNYNVRIAAARVLQAQAAARDHARRTSFRC